MPVPDCEAQLATLERLLGISTASLDLALMHACNEIAGTLGADKVDAFIYDSTRDTLVAIGSSTQELSRLQKVIDEGPGVSPEVLPHLFERFATGDRRKGLGIGLFLARRIAVLHGGDLTLETTTGKGARFRLTLPVT